MTIRTAVLSRAMSLSAVLPLVLVSPMVVAQASRVNLDASPVDELKRVYLACAHTSTHTVLDVTTAANCAAVGDELKHRAFGGDFESLIAWWHSQRRDAAGADVVTATESASSRAPASAP